MFKCRLLVIWVMMLLLWNPSVWALPGMEVVVQTPDGKNIPLYRNSYALVIGNGNYTKGWDPLPGALKDAEEVAAALKRQGFEVLIHRDLSHDRFQDVLNRFAVDYGGEPENQLLTHLNRMRIFLVFVGQV